jgi:hypothetical protein
MSRRHRPTARLTHRRRHAVHMVGLGVWLSGATWLLFHYFAPSGGEFGATTHPLEPWALKLHGAFAFAALWICGLLWGVHIVNGWSTRLRRGTGGALFGALAWLILSGYLLYYLGDETLRPAVSLLHWTIGLAVPIAFIAHRLAPRRHGTPQQADAKGRHAARWPHGTR